MSSDLNVYKNEVFFFKTDKKGKKTYKRNPMKPIVVHLPRGLFDYMDQLIKKGSFSNKAQIIRYCLRLHQDKFME